jgi:hypothetical protein
MGWQPIAWSRGARELGQWRRRRFRRPAVRGGEQGGRGTPRRGGARFDVPGRGGAHRVELSMAVRAVGDEPAAGAWPEGRRLTGHGGMPHRRGPCGSDDGLRRWPVESVRVEAQREEEEAQWDAPEKAPGLATGLVDAWRRRTGARRQITRLVAWWLGSSVAGEQRARGGEQRNTQLHSMARSKAAAKEKFPPRRCFTRIRPRSGARGGGSRSLSGSSGERPPMVTGAVALAHGTG